MTTLTCSRCRRAADPDLDCLVVILGQPLCSECAALIAAERDRAAVERADRADADLADQVEQEIYR